MGFNVGYRLKADTLEIRVGSQPSGRALSEGLMLEGKRQPVTHG
jgi:hypothetical protein